MHFGKIFDRADNHMLRLHRHRLNFNFDDWQHYVHVPYQHVL